MGQRARSLGLAGIMLLSVLAGMLMFDLDGSTEEAINLGPSIDGDSGISLQAGQGMTVTLIVSDEDLGTIELEVLIDGSKTEAYTISQAGEIQIDVPPDKRGVVLIEASVVDGGGLSDNWSGTFTVSSPGPILHIGETLPVGEGEKLFFGGTLAYDEISECALSWEEPGGNGGSLPIDLGRMGDSAIR